MPNHHHCSRRALSLTELLVVVTIVCLLASILMPALALVRNAANQTNCLSNLRQYGMAALAFAGDNQGLVIPIAQFEPVWDNHTHTHAFGSYAWNTCKEYGLERSEQTSCPTVRRIRSQPPSWSNSSYNYNQVAGGASNLVLINSGTYKFVTPHLAAIPRPSELLLFAETPVMFSVSQNSNWGLRCNLRDLNPNGLGNIDHAYVIHGTRKFATVGATGVDNCVAADGHAQSLFFTQKARNLRWPGTRINP